MYPGNNMAAISFLLKKSTKEFNIIPLYNSPHKKAPHVYAFMDFIMKEGNVPILIVGDFKINIPKNNNTTLCTYMKSTYNCYQHVKSIQ